MGFAVLPAADVAEHLSAEWLAFAHEPRNRVPARVVLAGDACVAIGSLARNLLHPEPRYFHYFLADSVDPQCLTPLLEALVNDLGTERDRAIHVSLPRDDTRMTLWAEGAGFRPIMTTWNGVLTQRLPQSPTDSALRRLSDADSPGMRRTLAILHSRIYREQHRWNPPAPFVPEMAESFFLDDIELIPEFQWYSTDEQNRPTGVASLRRTAAPEVLDFGWLGVLDGVPNQVHRALFDAALNAVGNRGLLLEVDENQQLTLGYLRELPVVWREAQVRFERRVTPEQAEK